MNEIPFSNSYIVLRNWEERELINKYKCLAMDRQHLIEVKTYRITRYEQRRFIDTTGRNYEQPVKVESREERLIEQYPY